MPSNETCFFVVDRIEGRTAVLMLDTAEEHGVPLRKLPVGTREGTVLRVDNDDGAMDWSTARIDEAETVLRQREAAHILNRLRKRDPGGDISL
jgi:hypothetical protein